MTSTTHVASRTGAALAVACVLAFLAALAARDASAFGPPSLLGSTASATGVVDVGPGVAVVVCHVTVAAEALGIPVVVETGTVAAFLAANPGDYAGTCRQGGSGPQAPSAGEAVPGPAAVEAGALDGLGEGAQVLVCAPGDGQLFLTADAAAALVRADARVTFGSCAANGSGGGGNGGSGGTAAAGSGSSRSVASAGALFVGSGVSVSASSLSCGDRLILTRVVTTPKVVRTAKAHVTARFVVVDDHGRLVRGANVWLRSTPLGRITSSLEGTTAVDGSVRFAFATTKQLQLRPGGRLVLFARATLPGHPLIGCVTGRRLVSVRVGAPRS